MFKSVLFALVALLAAMLIAAPAPASAAAGSRADGIRLQTKLTGKTLASGKADYREFTNNAGDTVRRLSIEVEDAVPGTIWGIRHNGVLIGQLKINNLGGADWNKQSITDDPGKQGAVPRMKAGDKITVGPGTLSGFLKNV
jgi:hypothetical protein